MVYVINMLRNNLDFGEYKKVSLVILVKIDRICRDNGINYFLFAGTLLGAVRHKGYIPWDDDIDICLMREDYDRLAKIIQNGDYGLNFIRIEENADAIHPYGKICDVNTKLVEKHFKTIKGYGAFVDVFPLDYLPESDAKLEKLLKKYYNKLRIVIHSARESYSTTGSKTANFKKAVAFYLTRLVNTHKLVKKINDKAKSLNKVKTSRVGYLCCKTASLLEDYSQTSEVEFEGYKFFAPKDPDRVLKAHFGDYMKLPPEDQRIPNHQLECYFLD